MQNLSMLDLHCHYLPGVDDGARTLDEGLALVRSALANGIERILLTPHVHPGRYDNALINLKPRFETFRRAIESAQLPVQLALGCEARLCDELLPMLERGEVPLLESAIGAKTLLLELPHSHIPTGCFAFIRWLQRRDIAPLLVHPERNKELMTHPQRLQRLREAGCLVQITAAAVIGRFGARAQRATDFFLEKDWVNIVASDAHNLRHRPPLMREAASAIAQRFGENLARQLTVTAPVALTAGNFNAVQKVVAQLPPILQPLQPGLAINCETMIDHVSPAEPIPEPLVATRRRDNIPTPMANDNLCDAAFGRMRSELLKRATEPNSNGAKAARILQLMNTLQAR